MDSCCQPFRDSNGAGLVVFMSPCVGTVSFLNVEKLLYTFHYKLVNFQESYVSAFDEGC